MKRTIIVLLYLFCGFKSTAQKCEIIKATALYNFNDTTVQKLNLFNEFIHFNDTEIDEVIKELTKFIPQPLTAKFSSKMRSLGKGKIRTCYDPLYNYINRKQIDSIAQICKYEGWEKILKNKKLKYQYASLFITEPVIIDNYAVIILEEYYWSMNATSELFIYKKEKGKFLFYKMIPYSQS